MNVSSSFVRTRSGSRMFWFRIAVPSDLRAQFGKPEISFSLKTADVLVAKENALKLAQKYLLEFERARRTSCLRDLDDETAPELITQMLLRLCSIYEQALDCVEISAAEYFDRWRHSELHRDFLANLLCDFGFKPDLESDGWTRLCSAFNDGVNACAELIQQEYPRLQKLEAEAAKARTRYNRRAGGVGALAVRSPETLQAPAIVRDGNPFAPPSSHVGVSGASGRPPEILFESQNVVALGGHPAQAKESRLAWSGVGMLAGYRRTPPESVAQMNGTGQTTGRSGEACHLSATAPTLVPSESRCSRSGASVSFATPPLLMQRLVCCIDRLNPQPKAAIRAPAVSNGFPL